MRRWGLFRPLGFILGLWSVLLTGEPQWLHTCPTAPTQRADATSPTSPHAHDQHVHGQHMHVPAVEDATPSDTGHHQGNSAHDCECVGVCACVALVSPPHSATIQVPAPAAVARSVSRFPEAETTRSGLTAQRRLPWPTAPPFAA